MRSRAVTSQPPRLCWILTFTGTAPVSPTAKAPATTATKPRLPRRALDDGLTAELLDLRDAGDRLVAVIHTHAPAEWERSPEPHGELITVRDGKVTEMVVYPTVEDAQAAAGLGANT